MNKKINRIAAITLIAASSCAVAQAQVPLEVEGPLASYTATTAESGTLKVMNNTVVVNSETQFVTPTRNRAELRGQRDAAGASFNNISTWIRGQAFYGRRSVGLIGATVIVSGTVDPVTGLITAAEVFSDVAENVILGVVGDNVCSNQRCDAPGDFIRGNGLPGVGFVSNKDKRLPALPIKDAGLFELDLTNKNLVGSTAAPTSFAAEGYFSQSNIQIGSSSEQGVVYWAFELGENRPDLLLNPGIAEISALKVRCTEDATLDVWGYVHAPVNAAGEPIGGPGQPRTGADGFIRVTMDFNSDGLITPDEVMNGPAPRAVLIPLSYGKVRGNFDVTDCGTSVKMEWMPNGGAAAAWATVNDVPVDRLRERSLIPE